MEVEQLEIHDYLTECSPFDRLPESALHDVVQALEIRYVRQGTVLLREGEHNPWFYLVRTGAVEVAQADGTLVGRFGEGEVFGYRSILRGGTVQLPATAIEDSLLYRIPGELFLQINERYEAFSRFFSQSKPTRLRGVLAQQRDDSAHTRFQTGTVRDNMHGAPLIAQPDWSAQHTAIEMDKRRVSSLVVMEDGALTGMITNHHFRNLVSAGLPVSTPLRDIMVKNPTSISADAPISEALLEMTRLNTHNIPVMDGRQVVGILTVGDLARAQGMNAVHLVNEIGRAENLDSLKLLSLQLPQALAALVQAHLDSYTIAHAISSVGEAFTRRLLELGEDQFGPAPIRYAWLALGSQAREEQTAHSDQDSALILDNAYNEEAHGAYFRQLAQFVSDGLNELGYIYCPGEVMATNPKWCQPLRHWKQIFTKWVTQPEPMALMHASIFFDLRGIYGDLSLADELQAHFLKLSKGNSIFQAHMAANALQYRPPLGLFRGFVLERSGAEQKALDLKKRGVVPIIDLARVHALASGVAALNTRDRLQQASTAGAISPGAMADLVDALEFISTVRLQHQARKITAGEEPDNFVPPDEMSSLVRRHLKDAFSIVSDLQEALAQRYQAGRF